MKNVFLAILFLALSSVIPLQAQAKAKKITLSKSNLVVVRTEVSWPTMAKASYQLLQMDYTVPQGDPIYLYLDTPGGSVSAGLELINLINSLDHKVITITNFAASMGFIIAQMTKGERYIVPWGTLMSHRASVQFRGRYPGNVQTRSAYTGKELNNIEKKVAKRIGISWSEYRKMIRYEYWCTDTDCVKDNVADQVVVVTCDKTLLGTTTKIVKFLFFKFKATYSDCPLISTPISLKSSSKIGKRDRKRVNAYFFNKKLFFKKYSN